MPSPSAPRAATPVPAVGAAPASCVLIVGRTRLESELRKSPHLTLVRSRSMLDAIGELSMAPELQGQPVLVLVGAAVCSQPNDAPHCDEHATDQCSIASFVSACVRVRGDAYVALACDSGIASHALPRIDAENPVLDVLALLASPTRPRPTLDASDSAGLGLSAVGDMLAEPAPMVDTWPGSIDAASAGRSPSSDGTVLPAELASFLSGSAAVVSGATTSGDSSPGTINTPSELAGDEPIVRALLACEPVLGVALDLARLRSGIDGLDALGLDEPPPSGAATEPVRVAGVVERVLCGPRGTKAPQLRALASWLSRWLTLERGVCQLREATLIDHLTGARNRRAFESELPRLASEARARGLELAILAFDIDNFKGFNDAHGHEAGDLILRETVQLLRSVVRPSDRVYRIGGDEFVLLLHDPQGPRAAGSMGLRSARVVVERFQAQISQRRFPRLGLGAPGSLSISGGMASLPGDSADPWLCLRRADQRALESKRSGKNKITFGPEAVLKVAAER